MKSKEVKVTRPQPECPECEKLARVSEESNKIGDFLSWWNQKGAELCYYDEGIEMWLPVGFDINTQLARYFNIDLDLVEKERRALLDWIRKQHEQK